MAKAIRARTWKRSLGQPAQHQVDVRVVLVHLLQPVDVVGGDGVVQLTETANRLKATVLSNLFSIYVYEL